MEEGDFNPDGEDEFKSEAKCKYHHRCTLYNLDALSLELEKRLCGRGQPVDENYEPQIPLPSEFKPSDGYYLGPNDAPCDAFRRHEELELIYALREQLDVQTKLFEKHHFL